MLNAHPRDAEANGRQKTLCLHFVFPAGSVIDFKKTTKNLKNTSRKCRCSEQYVLRYDTKRKYSYQYVVNYCCTLLLYVVLYIDEDNEDTHILYIVLVLTYQLMRC